MSTFTEVGGTPVKYPRLDALSILANHAAIAFDNIACTYTATTDVFALKSSTTLVATITVTYSDATKMEVSTVAIVTE